LWRTRRSYRMAFDLLYGHVTRDPRNATFQIGVLCDSAARAPLIIVHRAP
jgi:hypothetical protein